MAKIKIILADLDEKYLAPIEMKFLEELDDEIELEVITQESYFDEYFSQPRSAEILVVGEELYTTSLQRHNISNLFVLAEQVDEGGTEDLNITRIFKYTSIKEIFNEILGKSSDELNLDANKKQETQIIVVTSATGGVGKTTVAMGICTSLTKNYKKVLYVNSDQLQTFQYMMKNSTPIANLDVYSNLLRTSKEKVYEEIRHFVRTENFSYIPPFKAAIMSVGLSKSIYIDIAVSAKKIDDFDYIVIDTDSVFDEFKADLLNIADKVIFVTRQSNMSVIATNILMSNINGMNNEKYICVCNDFDKNVENALISSELTLKYTVNEYIEHLTNYDQLNSSDFVNYSCFQKLAYLFL